MSLRQSRPKVVLSLLLRSVLHHHCWHCLLEKLNKTNRLELNCWRIKCVPCHHHGLYKVHRGARLSEGFFVSRLCCGSMPHLAKHLCLQILSHCLACDIVTIQSTGSTSTRSNNNNSSTRSSSNTTSGTQLVCF